MTHENGDYIKALHAHGYRVTPQRLIVLDAVCELNRHATVADIQVKVGEYDSTIDRSTIYRAIEVLRTAGLIVESRISDEKVYKIAGESDHYHLVCERCGMIYTVETEGIRPLLERITQQTGFEIRADHLALSGICAKCHASN